MFRWLLTSLFVPLWMMVPGNAVAQESVTFQSQLQVMHQELNEDFCWFHPRVAAVPDAGAVQGRILICTLQKHLRVSDHYSGLYFMRSDDLGQSWSAPVLPPELDWKNVAEENLAVCDVTPGWHAPSRRLLVIGTRLRYSSAGEQLLDQPRSHQCAYATWDPVTGLWTEWKTLALPDEDSRHFLAAPGCVQWLVRPDGTLLLPMYSRGPTGEDFTSTVLHCRFDGVELNLIEEGDALSVAGGRGLVEPSLAYFRGLWYLTLRNDARGYVTTSRDGLHFGPLTPWKFADGADLGSYNTQQHWLVHDQGLFLAYTRRGANNDQIPRNRAPLFLAQVDPESLRVLRSTEQVLIPERGVMLGNFGACAITPDESWVTDAEYLMSATPHPHGADGSVLAARVKWSVPNRLRSADSRSRIVVLGDSITKGVRTGVSAEETFAALLETDLQEQGLEIEVVNLGIGGERTDQAVQRLARDVASLEPVLVTVMYGTNDSYVDQGRSESRLTADQFEDNLRLLVQELRRWGIQPVLMTEPRWGDKATLNGVGENPNLRLGPFMERTRKICRDQNLPLIDHYKIWSDAQTTGIEIGSWTTDQCHPNPEGHRQLAAAMLPVLQSFLKTSAGR